MTVSSQGFSNLVHSIAVSTQLAIQSSWTAVLLRTDGGDWFVTAADTRPDAPFMRVRCDGRVAKWLESEQAVLRANHPSLQEAAGKLDEWDRELLGESGVQLVAPVTGDDGMLGMVVAGPGVGSTHYPVSHLNFLKSMADMAGLAVSGHQALPQSGQQKGDEVLRRMAHDLKGPLATVMTYIDLVRQNKQGNLMDDQVARLDKAGRSGRRLLRLLNDFVDFARLRAGTLGLERSEFELSMVINEAVDTVAPLMEVRGQQLRCTVPAGSVTVWADRTRLFQVVSALLSNASRYSSDGMPVDLEAMAEGNMLRIRVVDRGRGMSEDQVARVFEPFAPDQPSRRSENDQADAGSGLGLVITQGLVRLHGGEIRLKSRTGEGTVAEFEMPVVLSGEGKQHKAA